MSNLPKTLLLRDHFDSGLEYIESFGEAPTLPLKTMPALNSMLWGLHPGELHILAARTSQGKSSMAMQIAMDLAQQNKKVIFFHLEMSIQETLKRMFCYSLNIDNVEVLTAQLKKSGQLRSKWVEFTKIYEDKIFFISEEFGKTWKEIISCLKELKVKPDCIIIDHINNIKTVGKQTREEINEYVRSFRAMCVKHKIAGVLCAQLNRGAMSKDVEPSVTHLKESGYIEESADVCLILWWINKSGIKPKNEKFKIDGKEYQNLTEDVWKNFFVLDVAKNRNGRCGRVVLNFTPKYYKFSDWQDIPTSERVMNERTTKDKRDSTKSPYEFKEQDQWEE